jgi:DNA-binding XRE family transcriptional regulator
MDTVWRKKRAQSGMTRADMAKELGVEYNKYKAMERGEIKMPNKLMDKFNEIISRGKNVHKLEQLDKQMEIDSFWFDVTIKENGQYRLMDRMKDFNINTYRELGLLLGYRDGTIFSTRLARPAEAPIEFKTKLYNFFQDELNRQLPKEKKPRTVKSKKKIQEVTQLIEDIKEIDKQMVEEEKCSNTNDVTHMFDTAISVEPMEFPIVPETTEFFVDIKEPLNLVAKYTVKINDIEKELAELSVKMLELNNCKKIYEEVLNDLVDRGE